MKILHIYKDYFPVIGGIENHIKVLAESQAAEGHSVSVLVCNPELKTIIQTINRVKVIKTARITTIASMPISIKQVIINKKLNPDVTHIHSPYPLGELSNWLFKKTSKTIITHHSDIIRQKVWLTFYGPILKKILRSADQIIATSPKYIETSPWLQPVVDKCTIIPLGVNTRRFYPSEKRVISHPNILFVGRFRYYKGIDILLQAITNIKNATLTVVGGGPLDSTWVELSKKLKISHRVFFSGEVDDKKLVKYYQQSNLFILPFQLMKVR